MSSVYSLKILVKDIELAQPILKKYGVIYLSKDGLLTTYHISMNELDRGLCNGLIELHIPYVLSIDYSEGPTVRHIYGFSENGEVIETYYHSELFYLVLVDGVQKQVVIQWHKQDDYRQVYRTKQLLKGALSD